MATVLHPKGNRITVLRDKEKTETEGGIQIPDNAKPTDHCIGTVLEVGEGVVHPHAILLRGMPEIMAFLNGPFDVRPIKPNDRVIYSRWAGIDMMVGGKAICVLEDKEIVGVLEGEGE